LRRGVGAVDGIESSTDAKVVYGKTAGGKIVSVPVGNDRALEEERSTNKNEVHVKCFSSGWKSINSGTEEPRPRD
tara:strand:+ start:47 stop:271 length:225 start_codon:yes stop_codon:yes gene_type:complete